MLEAVARWGCIGLRVRVHLREDCAGADPPHHPSEEGRIGTIVRCDDRPDGPPHRYLVELDSAVARPCDGGAPQVTVSLMLRTYAVDELELLD
jgi:hypothetical protein